MIASECPCRRGANLATPSCPSCVSMSPPDDDVEEKFSWLACLLSQLHDSSQMYRSGSSRCCRNVRRVPNRFNTTSVLLVRSGYIDAAATLEPLSKELLSRSFTHMGAGLPAPHGPGAHAEPSVNYYANPPHGVTGEFLPQESQPVQGIPIVPSAGPQGYQVQVAAN